MIKIAIQKSGRMYEESIQLLKESGLSIDNGKGQLKAQVRNFPAEILYLRNSDIPYYVQTGVADLAIIGQNTVIEKNANIDELIQLGFSKCRLSIATPKNNIYSTVDVLEGKRIATSYPNTLKKYLNDKNIKANIHVINGSVELAPNIGLADAICDLVSSGSTLFKNNLQENEIILKSQASLYANKKARLQKKSFIEQLTFRMSSVIRARNFNYILFNIPNESINKASKILPGLKSPTVVPLLEKGWSSLHSVIEINQTWQIIDKLKSVGAQGILISKMSKIVV
jgi:ATP phosphoribosyltransferase